MATDGAAVVGFVGLDDLSLDMAAALLRAGYKVQAFEVITRKVFSRPCF
jgi:3-hydroxyisobutyrate dehydrogenase-like beta-hydroxyacid dehydrogenase